MKENSKVFQLRMDGVNYDWQQSEIKGAEIRQLGKIPEEDQIFLKANNQKDDTLIESDDVIDISKSGIEHFYSKKNPEHGFKIIINGREKQWGNKIITYEQVVKLAFENYVENPDIVYTVDYIDGPHLNQQGSMVKGGSVNVKNKMIFNVTATNRS